GAPRRRHRPVGALAVGRMRTAVLCGAAALLVAGTACGERKEPTGPLVQVYPVTVQGAGERPAVVGGVPHRIVPLGPGPRMILKSLGLQSRIVKVDDSLVGLPLVAQIRHAKPDLIVAAADTDPLDLARARSSLPARRSERRWRRSRGSSIRMRFADLDAVTLDGFGTLLTLIDPVPTLLESLRERELECSAERITAGFEAEGEYYKPRSLEGHDAETLARLRLDCTRVFLESAGVDLDPAEFVDTYIDALRFELLPGVA